MGLKPDELAAIVNELSRRPGHEKVRTLVYELLVRGLDVPSTDIEFETQLEIRGRTDALLGYTVFEFKKDLRKELADVLQKLPEYLADREQLTGQRFIGIATDGAQFLTFRLRLGKLDPLVTFKPSRDAPRELLTWLSQVVSLDAELDPRPDVVKQELGRESLAYQVARSQLGEIWETVSSHPDVAVKRQLWARFLEVVYGSSVGQDDLFFQHTYLTVVAKTMATRAAGIEVPEPDRLLSGQPFHDAGIRGAVESDFFDWVITTDSGHDWVSRVCRQAARFRLEHVDHDVLKGLYESLIDPEQRHDLGEYYTPDWLASMMCARVITEPIQQRVLDPSCGSGTFLFHAVRRLLESADKAGLSNQEALHLCTTKVFGVDIHPVAVIIARVTYLLAIGEERLRGEREDLSIPVYLGDSLQWNTEVVLTSRAVRIEVPDGPSLLFPWAATRDPGVFDALVETMLTLSEERADAVALESWLEREGVGDEIDREVLVETYRQIVGLHESGRDHIWGYVARNLARPIWLSSEEQRADVIIGNPPWLSYRYMSASMQRIFREESMRLGVWVGGRGRVSHQDLSGYFFARSVELYLKTSGSIGFVMPFAVLSRRHFEKFRSGTFASRTGRGPEDLYASVDFQEVWALDERVQPLFQVPACVLFAKQGTPGSMPHEVKEFSGRLPKRDATEAEARASLSIAERPFTELLAEAQSPYADVFRAGAIVYPRALFIVERIAVGNLGTNPATPFVKSRHTQQEKPPWRDIPRLEGTVEREFLRPLYLGESIAPFRLLMPALAVLPWESSRRRLLDPTAAANEGYVNLHRWLAQVEVLWQKYGKSKKPLTPRLDYFHQLSAQMPPAPLRVLYAASGTLPLCVNLR